MQSIPALEDIPVIFISGYGRDGTIARALELGAADYIVKPFSPTELTARIRAALRRKAGAGAFRTARSGHPLRATPGEPGRAGGAVGSHEIRTAPRALGQRVRRRSSRRTRKDDAAGSRVSLSAMVLKMPSVGPRTSRQCHVGSVTIPNRRCEPMGIVHIATLGPPGRRRRAGFLPHRPDGRGPGPRVADGAERADAGVQPLGRLVTVLQDAARRAAKPLSGPPEPGARRRRRHLRPHCSSGGVRGRPRHRDSAPVRRGLGDHPRLRPPESGDAPGAGPRRPARDDAPALRHPLPRHVHAGHVTPCDPRASSRRRTRRRSTVSSIAVRLGDAIPGTPDRAASRIATDHLEAVAWATDDMVAPGQPPVLRGRSDAQDQHARLCARRPRLSGDPPAADRAGLPAEPRGDLPAFADVSLRAARRDGGRLRGAVPAGTGRHDPDAPRRRRAGLGARRHPAGRGGAEVSGVRSRDLLPPGGKRR